MYMTPLKNKNQNQRINDMKGQKALAFELATTSDSGILKIDRLLKKL